MLAVPDPLAVVRQPELPTAQCARARQVVMAERYGRSGSRAAWQFRPCQQPGRRAVA
jgi:hypothetical protein